MVFCPNKHYCMCVQVSCCFVLINIIVCVEVSCCFVVINIILCVWKYHVVLS